MLPNRSPRDGSVGWMPRLVAACLIAAYLAATVASASRRPFWHDELLTYYVAGMPTFGDVWHALMTGVEQSPPLFYVITRAASSLLGRSEVAMRLPELVAMMVAAACVYWLAARRVAPVFAAVGSVVFLSTSVKYYAIEARPYAFVVAGVAVAIVCWQRAALVDRSRVLLLAGLAASLTFALQMHYYGILAVGPLMLAESVRDWQQRRVDVAMWAALGMPIATLAALIPLVRAGLSHTTSFWARPTWFAAFGFYRDMLYPAMPAIVILCAACALARSTVSKQAPLPPLHERIAMAGFAALPFGGLILAKSVTGAFTLRYMLPAALGLSILFSWMLGWALRERTRVAGGVLLLVTGLLFTIVLDDYRSVSRERAELRETADYLATVSPRLPIAVPGPLVFVQFAHYATPLLAQRLVYFDDPALALAATGSDTAERGLLTLRHWAPLPVREYAAAPEARGDFLVYDRPAEFSWLVPQLVRDGRSVSVMELRNGPVLRVTRSSPSTARGSDR